MGKDIKVEKLEHDLMKSVLNGSLTVKEFNKVSEKIHSRCNYIVRKFITTFGGIVDWWDFDNEGGEDGPQGYFEPESYFESVGYTGKFRYNKYPHDLFGFLHKKGYDLEYSFPTKWIWTDFEDELDELDKLINEYSQWKNKKIQKKLINKEKRIQQKQQKEKLIQSALSKLTKEEIKALGY